jgi:hypothetical protein
MSQGDIAKEESTKAVGEGLKDLEGLKVLDDLEDELLPPLDTIVPLVQKAMPGASAIVSSLAKRVLNMPMSGLLHTVLIDLFPLYLFYYSSYSVLGALLKGTSLTSVKEDAPAGTAFAAEYKSNSCLQKTVQAMLWYNFADATDPVNCFLQGSVDNPPPLPEDDYGDWIMMPLFNIGAFTVCLAIWLAVLGNFFYWNKDKAVKARDGDYFKNSFLMRRTRSYRYLCGLLTLGIGASVGAITLGLATGDQWHTLRELLPGMIAAAVTGKPILKPKKPKFDYNKLSGVGLQRGSFFTSNASFASSFGDALMQAHRGFPEKLSKMLAEPNDWKQILETCTVEPESDSKASLLAHKVAKVGSKAKDAWSSLETKQPDTDKK